MENNKAIEISNLRMIYDAAGEAVHAIEGFNLDAASGEFVSVVGPSGCGKTTLLKILSGLLAPTSGTAKINNAAVKGPNPNVGIVFQNAALMKWRSALKNIMLQIEVRKLDAKKFREVALRLIDLVGIKGFENKYPYQLSGGMQQRVSICRALVHDPPLLLMDEPFGALDAFTREMMNMELQRIWLDRKKTVLFITHSIPEAVFLSDRVAVMSARPGTLIDLIEVNFPRPRNLDTMESPAFIAVINRIRRLMQAQSGFY